MTYSIIVLKKEQLKLESIVTRYADSFTDNGRFSEFLKIQASKYREISEAIEYLFNRNR